MKQGPTTLEELMEWPRRLCQDIWDGSDGEMRRARAAANLAAGLVLGSGYSGELCAETAIRMQCKGMLSHGVNVPLNFIFSYSACDVAPECRRLLLQSRHPPLHCFPDVLGYVSLRDRFNCSYGSLPSMQLKLTRMRRPPDV